jgi:hypothetical protein
MKIVSRKKVSRLSNEAFDNNQRLPFFEIGYYDTAKEFYIDGKPNLLTTNNEHFMDTSHGTLVNRKGQMYLGHGYIQLTTDGYYVIYRNDASSDKCIKFFIHPEDVKHYLWREIVITKPRKDEKG